jgi:hypothetical protein
MCRQCAAKAEGAAGLAAYFREKAAETVLLDYVRMMQDVAEELEELSLRYATRCQCGSAPDQQTSRVGRHIGRLSPISAGPPP